METLGMYRVDHKTLTKLRAEIEHEIHHGILPFWHTYSKDEELGGFYGRVSDNGKAEPFAPKSLILNTRILWSFSVAYATYGGLENLSLADRAYEYITQYFLDEEFGGVYWILDSRGNPVDDKKKVYGHAFLIYALSEYYGIKQEQSILDLAIETFRIVESHSFDRKNGGYFEAFQRDWTLTDDLRLSAIDLNEKKSMNAHLHVLEAYTNLYRYWRDPALKEQLTRLIYDFSEKIFNSSTGHYQLFFNEVWDVKSDRISFGHDIEGSWLICEAAQAIGDADLIKISQQIALIQASAVYLKGINDDGSLIYEIRSNGQRDRERHWWAQSEALVGFLNAYQLSSDQKYFNVAQRLWEYIKHNLIDTRHGEWHYKRLANGEIASNQFKISEWKGPYHNLRACIELSKRLGSLINEGSK